MAPPKDNDGHEERIQRLEDGFAELKAGQAETKTGLQHLSNQVSVQTSLLSERLRDCMGPIAEQLRLTNETVRDIDKRTSENRKQIDVAAIVQESQEKTSDTWKKGLLAALTGAIAIGLKELVWYFVKHA